MKYLFLILLYLIAGYSFTLLNFYDNGWQYLQPFLVAVLLVYFNNDNSWIYFAFATAAGLFVDAFTGIFGLHAIIFLLIVLTLKIMQLTILTSKNILSILLLTIWSFIMFWALFWLLNVIFDWHLYSLSLATMLAIGKIVTINVLLVIVLHLILFNFWIKQHEPR